MDIFPYIIELFNNIFKNKIRKILVIIVCIFGIYGGFQKNKNENDTSKIIDNEKSSQAQLKNDKSNNGNTLDEQNEDLQKVKLQAETDTEIFKAKQEAAIAEKEAAIAKQEAAEAEIEAELAKQEADLKQKKSEKEQTQKEQVEKERLAREQDEKERAEKEQALREQQEIDNELENKLKNGNYFLD